MPLTRISLRRGKPAAYRKAICDGLYRAMREALHVPEGDRFILVYEHDAVDFDYGSGCPGIVRSEDLIFIQITVNQTRTLAQKKALYRRLIELLAENPGLRPEDILSTCFRCPLKTGPSGSARRNSRPRMSKPRLTLPRSGSRWNRGRT